MLTQQHLSFFVTRVDRYRIDWTRIIPDDNSQALAVQALTVQALTVQALTVQALAT